MKPQEVIDELRLIPNVTQAEWCPVVIKRIKCLAFIVRNKEDRRFGGSLKYTGKDESVKLDEKQARNLIAEIKILFK